MCKYKALVILGVVYANLLMAGEIVRTENFNLQDFKFDKIDSFDVVKLNGAFFTQKVGTPLLPIKTISVLIPAGAEVLKIEIVNHKSEVIPGKYNIYPAQPPTPISYWGEIKFANPTKEIYEMQNEYPGKLIEISNIGSICGYKIVNIMFYPVQYIPKDRQVIFYNTIEFKILYKEGVGSNIYPNAQQLVKDRVKHLVVNPEDIGVFAPVQKISKSSPFLPADTVDYVIITSTQFDTVFQRLAYWKTKKGISSKVITTNWIYANYTGRDNPEKIRNFIKDATSTWGAIYFLLGGQCDFENGQEVVPRRDVYYYTSGVNIYPDEDTIPSDLYYSDLDRTWDDDNDGIWGEAPANGDTVDLYADVFVGRAPCFTLTQAQTFVNKVLTYEKNPGISYLKKLFLPAGILWDYYQGDTITQNLISDMLPADWQKSKLYERRGNLTQAAAVCSMNVGFALGHFVGHGNENGIYYGPGAYLNSTDADTLSNMPKIGIYNAISCMTGAIDYVTGGDCFAEILVNNPDGGVFASIMNTRYGWGNPPTMGPSEFIDTCFFNQIFCHSNYKLGKAHAYAKDGAVPYSWVNIWPWCIYELTLFGDPETDIWTDTPDTFEVVHNGVVPIGATSFSIIVRSGGIAVESAYVCLYKMNEVYSLAYTDINGNAVLTMSPPITHDTLYITITKHNYIPKESYAMVISPSGPYLIYQKYEIDDNNSGQSSGDNDSLIDAGETIELPIWVKNVGIDTAKNVTGILRTQDTFVTIIDSTDYFGNVFPNSTVRCTGNFVFQVDMNCPNNHSILFTIVMKDALDSVWTANFGVPVPAPIINYVDYVLDDDNTGQSSGNNDGYASPNERIELTIRLKNIGPVAADSVKSKLSTFDTFITVIDSIKGYGNILKDSVRSSIFPYVFDVASNCPRNHSVKFYLHSWDNNPATKDWVDSFNIKIWYPAQIMLVSKDPNYINYFTQALDSLNYSYDIYEGITIPANVNKFGSKNTISGVTVAGDTSIMKLYPIIVWSTGDLTSGTITENEQSALIWWLNRGGKLFVTGQDIGFDLQYNGLSFYNNYLHARYINDATDIDSLIGISGDLISDGIGLKISGGDGANNQSFPSEIDTMNGSSYVFQYVGDGYGAVNFFGTYKVVYFAFGFEGINNFITRKLVMQRVLEALGGPAVQYINVAPIYSSPQDTVVIYAKIIGDSITSCLTEIESPDEIVIDTVYLYDDGSHSDSAANDLVFANIWVTEATSKKYWVDLHVIDTEGYRVDINNGTWFSTFTPPVINLTPTAFSKTLVKDTSTVDTLWIWNTGESDLYFQIDMSYDSSSSLMTKLSIPKDNRFNNQININTFNPLYTTKHKPNDHWEAGPAVPFGFGGPDSFGYLWIDSDEPGGPSYNWIDITGTGTNAGITEDDENVGPFNIGFVFPFYGDTFTTFRICSNGWISFTSAWTSFFNETLPNPSEPYNLIAPFWTDLNPSDSGAIYYDTTRQDTLIIEFHNVPDWGGSGYYTFEIILTKQGKFIYQYNSMTGILNYATTGIQNKDGTIGLNIAYNTPYIHDGLAVKIYNTQQWLSVNPKNDTITAGESTGVVIGFNTQELDTANYYATLHLKSNDIYHPDTIIPIRLKVLRDTIEVEEMPLVPKTFFIAQNHPNPFIGTTVIEYGIPNAAAVTINIYNILGQKVATLVNENKKAGFYTVKWNGKNGMGKKVATGIYFYRLDTHEYTATKKMYLIR